MVDSLGRPLPELDALVVDVVRRQADSLMQAGWRYAFQVTATGQGRSIRLFYRPRGFGDRPPVCVWARDPGSPHGRAGVPAGVPVIASHSPASPQRRVAERRVHFARSGDARRPGALLYQAAYPDGPSDALNLPTLRGGLLIRAHLNPRIKDALIPGGIPPRVPVRELGLIGLSLALLIAIAALGLRVGALARLRSDLASSVTHELRTPLTQIRLAAETVLLGRSPNPEAERRSLASIVDETKRLQQLIDNVLHFSRAERRSTVMRVEPVELRPVVDRATDDLAPLVAGRGIVLLVDIPEDLVVQGNANALRQIVLNLLDNGARYGPDRQTVTVGAAARDGQVELWVEDRGPGVPAADRKRVWSAFVRLDRDRESVVTGTGLGLTVVRELVEAQGGRCWIEEAPGQGARVVVRLAKGAALQ